MKVEEGLLILHSPLKPTISSVRVLQITAEHTESLVEGGYSLRTRRTNFLDINNSNILAPSLMLVHLALNINVRF